MRSIKHLHTVDGVLINPASMHVIDFSQDDKTYSHVYVIPGHAVYTVAVDQ